MVPRQKDRTDRVNVSDERSKRTRPWIPAKPAEPDRHHAIEATVLTPESEHNRDETDEGEDE